MIGFWMRSRTGRAEGPEIPQSRDVVIVFPTSARQGAAHGVCRRRTAPIGGPGGGPRAAGVRDCAQDDSPTNWQKPQGDRAIVD